MPKRDAELFQRIRVCDIDHNVIRHVFLDEHVDCTAEVRLESVKVAHNSRRECIIGSDDVSKVNIERSRVVLSHARELSDVDQGAALCALREQRVILGG